MSLILLVWLLPLFSGAASAATRAVIKLTNVHRFTLVAAGYLFALPFYAVWLVHEGMPQEVRPAFGWAVAVHVPLLVLAEILIVYAHRRYALILTVPYTAFAPAFLLVTTPLMAQVTGIGDRPTWFGAVGVLIIVAGVYLLNTRDNQLDALAPFRALKNDHGAQVMMLVNVIFSVTANLDYVAFKSANAPFYLLVDHSLAAVFCIILATFGVMRRTLKIADVIPGRASLLPLVFYGTMIATSVVPHMLAFKWIPVVSYVIAVKRAGAIVFTVGLGLFMAYSARHRDRHAEERGHLRYRIPGVLVMIAGMLVIILWGKH